MSTGDRTRSLVVRALVVAIAVPVGVLVHQWQADSSSVEPPAAVPALSATGAESDPPTIADPPRGDDVARLDGLGPDDGVVADGVTVFEEDIPAVARLDPALLDALRRAATHAATGAIEMVVNSGWRSPGYQEWLLDEAVSRYGSREEAARWVATPETSAHVSGDAIDIGPPSAATWLSRHGTAYGLCQIYRNEPWHFELRPEATDHGCPTMYADPTHDPRVQQ